MATSGAYNFAPSLGELVLYAYNNVGVRTTSILQEHMTAALMATNLILASWSNKGVNLWKVDFVIVPLVTGQAVYSVDPSTVVILDAYVTIDNGIAPPIDRSILPITRTEFASFPNKKQQGFTSVYLFDRLNSGSDMNSVGSSQTVVVTGPQVVLWPVPDGSAQYLKYYRLVQVQTSGFQNSQNVDVPFLWLDALSDALSYRLARIWNPKIAPALKKVADESYDVAAVRNVEKGDTYIIPQIQSYYRP